MVDESVNGQLGGGIFVMPLQIIFSSANRVFRPGAESKAKLLLTTTTRPVKEISYSLKYENPEYFSMFFKRRTSMTPVEYRNIGSPAKDEEERMPE